jgi:prepilin-type N-terminal cleavage/methylation domain-containing protein
MKISDPERRQWPPILFEGSAPFIPRLTSCEAGFTLMELILTIVIAGMLAGFSAQMLVAGADTFDYLTVRKEGLEDSRIAMQRIVKEVRQALDPGMIQKATADSLRYTNVNNQSVQVRYINQSISLNGQALIDHVSQFNLRFFDGSGAQLAFPISNTANIWRIRVSFVYSNDGQSMSLQQDIVPRNFRN